MRFMAYVYVTIAVSSFIYPVAAHWTWARVGWLAELGDSGVVDFSGAGPVHVLGGTVGLLCAVVLGPRIGFHTIKRDKFAEAYNKPLAASGAFLLWLGWMCVTTVTAATVDPDNQIAASGRIATVTTLSGAAAAITSFASRRLLRKNYDLISLANSLIIGLVAITGPCGVVQPWAALVIGGIASLILTLGSDFLAWLNVDDPLDAVSIHLFGGAWGLLSSGFFADPVLLAEVQNRPIATLQSYGVLYGGNAELLGVQVAAALSIFMWTILTTGAFVAVLHRFSRLRVTKETELGGLDLFKHTSNAYIGAEGCNDGGDGAAGRHLQECPGGRGRRYEGGDEVAAMSQNGLLRGEVRSRLRWLARHGVHIFAPHRSRHAAAAAAATTAGAAPGRDAPPWPAASRQQQPLQASSWADRQPAYARRAVPHEWREIMRAEDGSARGAPRINVNNPMHFGDDADGDRHARGMLAAFRDAVAPGGGQLAPYDEADAWAARDASITYSPAAARPHAASWYSVRQGQGPSHRSGLATRWPTHEDALIPVAASAAAAAAVAGAPIAAAAPAAAEASAAAVPSRRNAPASDVVPTPCAATAEGGAVAVTAGGASGPPDGTGTAGGARSPGQPAASLTVDAAATAPTAAPAAVASALPASRSAHGSAMTYGSREATATTIDVEVHAESAGRSDAVSDSDSVAAVPPWRASRSVSALMAAGAAAAVAGAAPVAAPAPRAALDASEDGDSCGECSRCLDDFIADDDEHATVFRNHSRGSAAMALELGQHEAPRQWRSHHAAAPYEYHQYPGEPRGLPARWGEPWPADAGRVRVGPYHGGVPASLYHHSPAAPSAHAPFEYGAYLLDGECGTPSFGGEYYPGHYNQAMYGPPLAHHRPRLPSTRRSLHDNHAGYYNLAVAPLDVPSQSMAAPPQAMDDGRRYPRRSAWSQREPHCYDRAMDTVGGWGQHPGNGDMRAARQRAASGGSLAAGGARHEACPSAALPVPAAAPAPLPPVAASEPESAPAPVADTSSESAQAAGGHAAGAHPTV